jgi:F0F1-type ATP synthase membrane subunit c/vacuolar-type H+-ATPase subunit K
MSSVGEAKKEGRHVRSRDKLILIVALVLGLAALSAGIAVGAAGGDSTSPVVSQEPGDDTNGTGEDVDGQAGDDGANDDEAEAKDESDESLTGDAAAKASEAALAATGGGTVLGVEPEDEGARYEVEIRQADGTETEVELDQDFNVLRRAEDD